MQAGAVWTLIISAIIVLPVILTSLWDLVRKPKDLILSHHLLISTRSAGSLAIKTLFTVICLPYEAFMNLGTITRTIWRMLLTHRKLLEWSPFGSVERSKQKSLFSAYVHMWTEPFLAIAFFIYFNDSSRLMC